MTHEHIDHDPHETTALAERVAALEAQLQRRSRSLRRSGRWTTVAIATAAVTVAVTAVRQPAEAGGSATTTFQVVSSKKDCDFTSSNSCGVIKDGAVKAADLGANSVGGPAIAPGAVGQGDIAQGAVGPTQIAPNAVTGVKIADGSIDITTDAKPLPPGAIPVAAIGSSYLRGLDSWTSPAYASDIRMYGLAPRGTTITNSGSRTFAGSNSKGVWTCSFTSPGGSATSCFAVPTTGQYRLSMTVTWASNAAGTRCAGLIAYRQTLDGFDANEYETYASETGFCAVANTLVAGNTRLSGATTTQVQRVDTLIEFDQGEVIQPFVMNLLSDQAIQVRVEFDLQLVRAASVTRPGQ